MSSKQDRNGVRTAQDLERKYNLSAVTKNIEHNDTQLIEIKNEMTNFVNETANAFNSVNNKIDESLAYIVEIVSSNGTVFKNGEIATTLSIVVRKSNEDITDQITDTQVSWKRVSKDSSADEAWNIAHQHTKTIEVTAEDIYVKAVFNVYVDIERNDIE